MDLLPKRLVRAHVAEPRHSVVERPHLAAAMMAADLVDELHASF